MPSLTGSFSGRITKQSTLSLSDQPDHQMSIVEVNGTQKSSDMLWNNLNITCWGVKGAPAWMKPVCPHDAEGMKSEVVQ